MYQLIPFLLMNEFLFAETWLLIDCGIGIYVIMNIIA